MYECLKNMEKKSGRLIPPSLFEVKHLEKRDFTYVCPIVQCFISENISGTYLTTAIILKTHPPYDQANKVLYNSPSLQIPSALIKWS